MQSMCGLASTMLYSGQSDISPSSIANSEVFECWQRSKAYSHLFLAVGYHARLPSSPMFNSEWMRVRALAFRVLELAKPWEHSSCISGVKEDRSRR